MRRSTIIGGGLLAAALVAAAVMFPRSPERVYLRIVGVNPDGSLQVEIHDEHLEGAVRIFRADITRGESGGVESFNVQDSRDGDVYTLTSTTLDVVGGAQ